MLQRNTFLYNRYRIIRSLGRGGFGQVYEALDDKLDCIVAIKERLAKLDSEKMRRAFEREAKLLANLRHPVLPKVMDHFFAGEGQYLVMEFIEGDDLSKLLAKRQHPFPVERVLVWADDILKALIYLHTRPEVILHRDIKPANIKLTNEDEIFLLDFGLAKGYAGEMALPETSQRSSSVHGYTAAYAPLEQLTKSGTNEQSDIYSLGATLYHLLTSKVPVTAAQRYKSIELGKRDPLLPAQEINPAVPLPVSLVLSQAMAMSRKDRIGSAVEMRQALTEARRAIEEAETKPPQETVAPAPTEGAREANTPRPTAPSPTVPSPSRQSHAPVPDQTLPVDLRLFRAQPFADQPPTQDEAYSEPQSQEISWSSQLSSQAEDSSWASTVVDSEIQDDEATIELQTEEIESRRRAQEEVERRLREEEARQEAEEKRLRAEEEARRKAEAAAKRLAEEAAARKAAEEAGRQAEVEAKRKAQEERQRAAAEAARLLAAARRAEAEAVESAAAQADAEQKQLEKRGLTKAWMLIPVAAVLALAIMVLALIRSRYSKQETAPPAATLPTPPQQVMPPEAPSKFSSKPLDDLKTGSEVFDVALSQDGRVLASTGNENKIRVWEVSGHSSLPDLTGYKEPGRVLALSPDGQTVASGNNDGSIRLWNMANATLTKTIPAHGKYVFLIRFSKDGQTLVSAGADKLIRRWRVADGQLLIERALPAPDDLIVTISPDQKIAALYNSSDRQVHLFSIGDDREINVLENRKDKISSGAFSPDGQLLALGTTDGTIRVWRANDGRLISSLKGSKAEVSSIAFSPDGQLLAIGWSDGAVRLMRMGEKGWLQTLDAHAAMVNSLAFSGDGQILASGSNDKSIKLWQLSR
jgi:serine/threonine protein kinase